MQVQVELIHYAVPDVLPAWLECYCFQPWNSKRTAQCNLAMLKPSGDAEGFRLIYDCSLHSQTAFIGNELTYRQLYNSEEHRVATKL